MFASTLILTAALLPAQPNEGERLLHDMEEKITAARSLRIEFEMRSPKHPEYFSLSLVVDGRNRFRMEGGWVAGPDLFAIVVSDGNRMGKVSTYRKTSEFRPIPDGHNELLRSWLGRYGAYLSVAEVQRGTLAPAGLKGAPAARPRIQNIRLLPDEEVKGVKCRVVGYDLAWQAILGGAELSDARVRVWIDPNTSLPVRREMKFESGRAMWPEGRFALPQTWTETVRCFEIDPQLSDSLFAMPTEADLLLAQMDARIKGARSLRIEFEVRIPKDAFDFARRGTPERTMTGSLILGEGNRFRQEFHDPGTHVVLVSNGRQGVFLESPTLPALPIPRWYGEVLRSWLGRGGTVLAMHEVESRSRTPVLVNAHAATATTAVSATITATRTGAEDGPKATNIQLLPDEQAGGVKCRVIGYDLSWRGSVFHGAHVRVWLDPKTALPVRREMALPQAPGDIFSATHTKFEIDPKLDDKLFELSK